jgi:hypothetical protein
MFFRNEGPVPETLVRLRQRLDAAQLPHILMGAMALQFHGFQRTTNDVDICMRSEDLDRFRKQFVGREYEPVPRRSRRFVDPISQVTIDILVAGEVAGDQRRQEAVKFPDPAEAEIIDGIPVPSLARIIELKLVTWRFKDWGDVVELIRLHELGESFADSLNPVARSAYLQCYDQKIEEDRYNPEIHDSPPA